VVVDDEAGDTRYRLLETIRQYARDKLLEAGESAQMRNAHLAFFVEFAQAVEPKIDNLDALDWVIRLEAEYDNFRTALEWGLQNDVLAVLKVVIALMPFWIRRGHEAEGIHWAIQALAQEETLRS